MLTQICQYLKNWFNRKEDGSDYPKYHAVFVVNGGKITFLDGSALPLAEGQHFRILGSNVNDGVHQHPAMGLKDETFDGTVWAMSVPPVVQDLAKEIAQWQAKYGGVESVAMSPFSSESFGGYSYTKSQGFASTGGGMLTTWQSVFANQLAPWRKI